MNSREYFILGILAVLVLAGYMVSLYTTASNAAYWWDEAEYGVLSRGISQSGDFTFFGERSYRPPFIPLYLAVFRGILGEYANSVFTPFFSALSVLFVFLIARKLFDWKAGAIAALLMIFSSLYIFYSGRLLTEIPGILFSALSAYFLFQSFETGRKRDFLLTAIFSATAFLIFFRFMTMLVAMVAFVLLFRFGKLLKEVKMVGIAIAAFIALLLPLFYYSQVKFGDFLGVFTVSYFGQQAEPLEWFIYGSGQWMITHIFSNFYVVMLLLLAIIYAVMYGKRELKYLAAMNLLIFIVASVLLNHKEDRYLMPMFPIAFITIGAFASDLVTSAYSKVRSLNIEGSKMEASAFQILLACLVILMIYFATFSNVAAAFSLFDGKKASFGDVKEAALYVRDNAMPNDEVITDSVTAMFYTNRVSHGFDSNNITRFTDDLRKYKPAYLIATLYESRENYANALNNYKNVQTPSNSMEYMLLNEDKFQILKVYPSEQQPYVMVLKINQ
ncbi:MAG: glycosyltransferase family 39 protein [Candidatus Micrarchaeota archaeon]